MLSYIKLCCAAGLCILIARFCHHKTHGFALGKITDNFPLNTKAATSPPLSADLTQEIYAQKFHFLGRGFQSFVFISDDDRYVLKLFSNRYQHKMAFFSFFAYFPWGGNWAQEQREIIAEKLDRSFNSYQLAFDEMASKTALLYLHLHPSANLPKKLIIVDPLHIAHPIDLNQFAFLIQKKVSLAYPSLQRWVENGHPDLAKEALSSLIQLFIWKRERAIDDNDPLIRTNYGFIGTEAVQIDVGPLSKRKELKAMEPFKQEITKITASLKNWLTQNAPELLSYLDQELEERLSSIQ